MAEPQRFADIQGRVMSDTFNLLGVDPETSNYAPNEWALDQMRNFFSNPGADPADAPDIWQSFDETMVPNVMATFDQLGYEMGGNPDVMRWVDSQRVNFARFWPDPEQKNRAGGLLLQSYLEGKRRADTAGDLANRPTPTPTATPTPSLDDEIEEAEKRRQALQGAGY